VLDCGSRGRRFEPGLPPNKQNRLVKARRFCYAYLGLLILGSDTMKKFKEILIITTLVLIVGCTGEQKLFVDYSDPDIAYEGRIDTSQNRTILYWSGSSVKINFEGSSIGAVLKEGRSDNYYNVIIDEDSMFILKPEVSKKYHRLASNLSAGPHSVELFKRTEWDRGTTTFYGFQIEGDPKVLPRSQQKKRKIEFYGNSITAGYAVEDFSGDDSPDSTYTNNYLSYSAILARHYDAEYSCICRSGIGINISWFPVIMPDIYDKLNPEDPESQWDFSLYQPDIVVINLMQNDSWLVNMPESEEFQDRFGDKAPGKEAIISAYEQFVANIREQYPTAAIICALGNMDATKEGSEWPGYVSRAVSNLNDSGIYTHFVDHKDSPGHPTIEEQQDMAESFIQFIDENISW
jgi:hypothetical protein